MAWFFSHRFELPGPVEMENKMGKKIVITVTGHGLKDISWALEKFAKPKIVKVNAVAAAKALGLK